MTRNIDQNMVRQWFQSQMSRGPEGQRTTCRKCGQVLNLSDETERLTGLCDVCFQKSLEGKPLTYQQTRTGHTQRLRGNPNDLQSIIQKENEYFKRYGRPTEADFSINDIQREKIKAYYQQHPQMYVGKINRTERVGSPLEQYVGQKVLNFQYDFIIPKYDAELERLLLEREQAPYTGTKEDAERLDKIYVRVKTIGGLYLYWA